MADNFENEPQVGMEPERPRLRKLNQAEIEQWSKGIHKVCEGPSGSKRGWVPQLRAAFSHLMPFVDEECPTAYTDCRYRIGINPDFLDPDITSVEQLAFIILHETMHNTQHHRQRLLEKKGLNGKLCNFATDLEINGIIAQGVCGIELARGESPANGNWDYLYGEFKQLTAEEAEKVNAFVDENGKPRNGRLYKTGDWFYQGGLFPRAGQFHDFPTDMTAEQYLSLLEVEEEDMTLEQFMSQRAGNGDGDGDANGGNEGSPSDGADQGDGNGNSNGSGQGNSDGDGKGGQDEGNGNGDDTNSADAPGGNDSTDNSMSDGWGGQAEPSSAGHVKVTRIYKKNADGSRTEVGKDALVDDLGGYADNEDLWDEVSKMGINPISRGEEQKVKDQIAHDIENYRRSNAYGSGHSNDLLNYIERGLRPPVVNWQKMLRHSINRACQEQMKGRDDYTYRRINRRYSQGDFIFPGTTSYLPTIRFALDTSGSMSADEYYNALSEAEGILRLSRARIQFCCWDGDVGEVKEIKTIKEMKEQLVGGGGTLPDIIAKRIGEEKKKERPDVLVIATDGCFEWKSFAESLSEPAMRNIIPIVLVVYKFDEDRYYAQQGDLADHQALLRKFHRKAQVLQAWTK